MVDTISAVIHNNFSQKVQNKAFLGGTILVFASVIANFLNFLFNALLGRLLTLPELALISLMGSFLSIASILFGGIATVINYKSAFLIGKHGNNYGYSYWRFIRKRAVIISVIITILWICCIPFTTSYFHSREYGLFILFSIILLVGFVNGADKGFLSSKFEFSTLGYMNLVEPIVRFAVIGILIALGISQFSYAAIPFALLGTFLVGWIFVHSLSKSAKSVGKTKEITEFPVHFLLVSLITGFSSITFTTLDIILANHYLNVTEAGSYALLSLVGKMVYFLGGLITPFIIPIISRNEGANRNSKNSLSLMIWVTFLLSFLGFIMFGLFGKISIPLLYGEKANTITRYATLFTFGMMCFSVSRVLVNYYLVKKQYIFTVAGVILGLLQYIILVKYHHNSAEFSLVMSGILVLHLLVIGGLHIFASGLRQYEKALLSTIHQKIKRVMKRNMAINKPTSIHMGIGTIITIMKGTFSKKHPIVPKHIQQYKLVEAITKKRFARFSTGIYEKKGKLFFIKTWHGKVHDLHYYSMINLCLTAKVLEKHLNSDTTSRLYVPKLHTIIKEREQVSCVFEYINGKELSAFSVATQRYVLQQTISELKQLIKKIPQREQDIFSVRGRKFYLLTFPIIAVIAVLCNLNSYKLIFASTIRAFYYRPKHDLTMNLSYRDLTPENILLKDGHIYLLDWERILITDEVYDSAYIAINVKDKQFRNFVHQADNNIKKSMFFKIYILLHMAADPFNPSLYQKHYMARLKELNSIHI